MLIAYFVVGFLILLVGVCIMAMYITEEAPEAWLRVVAIFTAGSWAAAILWPVLLVTAVPALIVYGIIAGVKAVKEGDIDY